MAFQVLVDSVQSRLKLDGLSTLVGAKDWDIASSTGTYLDGVTGSAFLLPGFLQPAWLTSNVGIFQKLAPGDFTLTPPSTDPNWSFPIVNTDGAQWCKYANNAAGAGGIMNVPVATNQAMIVETSKSSTTSGREIAVDCGWGTSISYLSGVSLRFWTDNSADVWKDGTFLGNFVMGGQAASYGQTNNQVPSASTPVFTGYMLLPCRERELLVISDTGAGFSLIFGDIPEGTPSATITPNAPFWFYAAPGVDAQIRCSVCQFQSTGNIVGKQSFWRFEPGASPVGGFQTYVDGTAPAGTAVSMSVADGINPNIPYANNTNGVRLNVALSGSGLVTPFIYGARGYTLTQKANTIGPPLDVVNSVVSMHYESSDSVSGTRCSVRLNDPRAIEADGAAISPNSPGANIDIISERPWQIFDVDGTQIMEALNEPPKLDDGARIQFPLESSPGQMTYGDQSGTNRAQFVDVELRDGWMIAENFLLKEVIPCDGLSVYDAYSLFTDLIGFNTPNISTSLNTVFIRQAGNPTDKFNLQFEPGDKGSDILDRIVKTYCANYFHALVPSAGGWTPTLLSESDMPSSVAIDLYDSFATAIGAGASSPTPYQLFRKANYKMLRPEANDVYIMGYDFRTQRPILAHKQDDINMDPTVIPALRKPAWRGQRISYAWVDPTIGDIDTATYACNLIFDRISVARSLAEIECDFNSALPRGALVRLHYLPGGGPKDPITGIITNPVVCRVKSISAKFQQVDDVTVSPWRPTTYICEVGTSASNLETRHTNVVSIGEEWILKSVSKKVIWGDARTRETWTRPIIDWQGL